MNAKIDYYLSNTEERNRIAKNGFDYCHSNFTYKNMSEHLIKLVENYSSIS